MKIEHHPDDATLMSYASGSLPEPLSAVVAAHIELCPQCACEIRAMERIGATLFEHLAPAPVSIAASHACREALTTPAALPNKVDPCKADTGMLTTLLGGELSDIHWKRLGFGIWHYPIKLSPGCKGDLRLLKVGPGQVMPEHSHGGSELTLILGGSYSDEFGTYRPGDLSDLGDDVDHQPVSDSIEGCICLIASDRKARFKNLLARIVQPITGL